VATLPACSGQDAIRVFTALGWQRARQVGSHVTLVRPGTRPLTIPLHRELAKGTLRALIRAAGITVDDFVALL